MKDNYTETYDFLVSIIGSAPYGIIAIDGEGTISMCNKLALDQLSIKRRVKDIVGSSILDDSNKIPKLHKRIINYLDKGRKSFNVNNVSVHEKTLNIKGRPILSGMIITTSDITEAKETERKIMSAVLEGQENERRRLAKEIHDGIGPLMSTIKLNLESVKNDMDDASEKTLKKMENMEDLVYHVANDIRSISHALMPSALKDFGLIPALENLILKINNSEKINIQLFHSGLNQRLDELTELGLYRITQELINNALKYADAKTMTIQLVKHPKDLTLTVEDDGVGFDKEKINQLLASGIGLRNMKARTEALQGIFTIDSSPGNGVMATVEVPL